MATLGLVLRVIHEQHTLISQYVILSHSDKI